jgi:predicted Zn-dependent protease
MAFFPAARKTWLLLLGPAFLLSCQTSPTGRRQLSLIPESQMNQMGEQAFAEMKSKQAVENDPALNAYVRCVANSVTNAMPDRRTWEVVVFKDDSANAFALPGGKIGVHTGLMKVATNQSQLATVLGHEVGHVIAHHGQERVSEQMAAQGGLAILGQVLGNPKDSRHGLLMGALGLGAQYGVLLPHGRKQESEADVVGLDLMAKAGFDPRQSVELWKNMAAQGGGGPEFLSTHPSHGTRIQQLQERMPTAMAAFEASGRRPSCQR